MVRRIGVIIWFWTPVILWMALIFYSSSLPAEDMPKFDLPYIDKLFHFVEYFIFGAILVRAFANSSEKGNLKLILLLSVFIASLYGGIDEFHQHFVPGRSPEIFDIISDIIGASVGALLSVYKERINRAVNKTV